jgi:hypothetical protein
MAKKGMDLERFNGNGSCKGAVQRGQAHMMVAADSGRVPEFMPLRERSKSDEELLKKWSW